MLEDLLLSFTSIASRHVIRDDDVVDQLNHWATVGFLMALALVTGAKQYVGSPIRCWIPAQYDEDWHQDYVDNYCWINDMYYFPFSDPIPAPPNDRWQVEISFYRWVMVMFLLQALLFKLPNLLWTEMRGYSGLNVEKVVGMIQDTSLMTPEDRKEQLSHAAVFIHRWLKSYTQYRNNAAVRFRQQVSGVLFCFGKRTGNYLIGLYMFIKLLYLINVFGQFFLLSSFLGVNFWNFGFDAMSVLFADGHWEDHYTFPRIGLCDYQVRQLSNLQTYSVQCVLPFNLFLEKMYLLLWFWMIVLFVSTIVNFGLWFIDNALPTRNKNFMLRYAKLLGIKGDHKKSIFRQFAFDYLNRDGVFILRMVAKNTSTLLCTELVKELWKVFLEDPKNKNRKNGDPSQPSAPNADHLDEIETDENTL